ncbi:MAG: TetR family transcriptional regulator [Steroidobacteraceae bacterium]
MPSRSTAPRRIPQQKRGKRRVAGFLRAAASVITEKGYEQATMSAIAERANSCIGSLYQFFPNKPVLADALRARYIEEIEQSWIALAREARTLGAGALARRLVALQLELVTTRPALLALLDVRPTAHGRARRELIRTRIASVLIEHNRRLSRDAALRTASVVQQISRGLLGLYAQANVGEKPAIIKEFEAVLVGYLVPRLTR